MSTKDQQNERMSSMWKQEREMGRSLGARSEPDASAQHLQPPETANKNEIRQNQKREDIKCPTSLLFFFSPMSPESFITFHHHGHQQPYIVAQKKRKSSVITNH